MGSSVTSRKSNLTLKADSYSSILKYAFVHDLVMMEVLVDGNECDLFIRNMSKPNYADAFLALDNHFSGPVTDVYQ